MLVKKNHIVMLKLEYGNGGRLSTSAFLSKQNLHWLTAIIRDERHGAQC